MLISSLLFPLKKNKKVEFFFGDYQPSKEFSSILEEKSCKTNNGLSRDFRGTCYLLVAVRKCVAMRLRVIYESQVTNRKQGGLPVSRVDTKWRIQFFAKYDYRFLLDVIIASIATFFAKAIIAIPRLSLSILLE